MTTLYRAFMVAAVLYLLFRHPSFWGDILWAAAEGTSFVSSLAEAESDYGKPERCVPHVEDGRWTLCIN